MTGNGTGRRRSFGEVVVLALFAGVSLLPFILYHDRFARLFWFGDEFDLIDQIDRLGFWRWVGIVFAENFVPLFKLLWGGAVFALWGSYAAMLAAVWIVHALNVALLGRVMRAAGLTWAAVALGVAVFGLSPINYETLGWSVQGSAVISVTFMLLAMEGHFSARPSRLLVGWVAASALSFSRGVLTGPVLGVGLLLEPHSGRRAIGGGLILRIAWLLMPSVAVALLIAGLSSGNHQHMTGHWTEAAVYGLWYFCANPLHGLLSVEPYGWHAVVALGAMKLGLEIWVLARSSGRIRALFGMLLLFEIGNSALLGIGRYHTGLPTAVSSRYQYSSLLGFTPFVGYAFSRLMEWIRLPRAVRMAFAGLVLGVLATIWIRGWSDQIAPFAVARGDQSRRILFEDPDPPKDGVPGIPGLPMERAKTLVKKYRLH